MAVDDLWYLQTRDERGQRRPSKRYGRGKRWRVRWIDPDTGGKREELFERRADAERADATRRADIARGQYVDPRAGLVTVAEYAEQWRAGQLHRDSTARIVEQALRLHVVPVLGALALGQVRASHLRAWVKAKSDAGELAPSTLHLVYGYISAMFAAAVADRLIGVSPCTGVRLPEIVRGERFIPTPEQVHALADAVMPRYRPALFLAAGCGLRGGEVFGLELDHVDFLRREVHVRQQLKRMTGRPAYLGQLKTTSSRRTVELPDVVAAELARHIEQHPPGALDLDDETDPRRPGRRPARLLVTTSTGQAVNRSGWSKVWRTAVRRAGLPDGFGLHGMRHYYATLLIHGGASVKTVQLALGHATPTVTLNTYAHEWPDLLERTRPLVDRALGGVSASAWTG